MAGMEFDKRIFDSASVESFGICFWGMFALTAGNPTAPGLRLGIIGGIHILGMGNGAWEWGMGNGAWGMGNGAWGTWHGGWGTWHW